MDAKSPIVDLFDGKYCTIKSKLGGDAIIESDEDSDTSKAPWESCSSDESQEDESIVSDSTGECDGPSEDKHALLVRGNFEPIKVSKPISRTAKRAQLVAMDLEREAYAVGYPNRGGRPNRKPSRSLRAKGIIPSNTELTINIKKYKLFSEWKWTNGSEDTCGICRMPFEACCIECKTPGDECPLVIGECKHPFHLHCINQWTDGQTTTPPKCPLCRQEWKNRESILGAIE
uniref:Anaphase-promoting complex subunit 11 n=1 Tax=Rhabditophanes sp. KR3021 TaxID=114890 RepID=A0AC35TKK0_9BILA